jgi:hypothetical protein
MRRSFPIALVVLTACRLPTDVFHGPDDGGPGGEIDSPIGPDADAGGGPIGACSHVGYSLAATPIFAGSSVTSVAVADLDKDGFPDVVVTSAAVMPGTVTVLLNDRRGGFPTGNQIPAPLYTGSAPQSVVLADVDGNGFLDLVVANSEETSVGVFLNQGGTGGTAGTFSAMVPYQTKKNPSSVAVGDFDRNPGLDLVVTDMNVNGWVSILPNAGSGTFPAHNDFQTEPGGDPWAVAVANFNGDALDLVVVNHATGSVNLLLGDSSGNFQTQPAVPVGKQPTSVAVGHVRGGGGLYVFVTNSGSGSVSVLQYENVNGNRNLFWKRDLELQGMSPRRVVARDMNRDDKLDLVIADGDAAGTVSVLIGNGDGTFQLPPTVVQTSGVLSRSIAVEDMNGDGLPDIVVANDSGAVNVLTAHCMP